MSERHEPDVLFPWEIERARRATEAPQAKAEGAPGTEAEVKPEVEAEATPAAEATPETEAAATPAAGAQATPETAATLQAGGVGAEAALTASGEVAGQAPADAGTAARAEGAADADGTASVETRRRPSARDEHADDDDRFAVLDTEFARRAAERASAALRDKPIAQKEYYSISEVCELVALKPHVLRYWETQFHVLNPSKNRSGNRVYQRKEIRLIMLVKHLLYEEKYTVEGAKAKLDQLRRGRELAGATGVVLDRSMAEQLRADLSELTTLLTPPSAT